MARIKYADGTVINFNGTPSDADIQEAYQQVSASKKKQTPTAPASSTATPPGLGQKLLGAVEAPGKALEAGANFMFGSTGKAVGSLLTSGIGGATELAGQVSGSPELLAKGKRISAAAQTRENITPTNIALTALELYPGGGYISDSLKALPGGEKIAAGVAKLIDHIPASLRKTAIKQYEQALKPGGAEAKVLAEKVVPGLLEKGVKMTSPAGLAEKASGEIAATGGEITAFFERLPDSVKMKVAPVMDVLSKLKDKYQVAGKEIRPEAIAAIKNVEQKIMSIADSAGEAGMKDVRKLRQIFDEHFDASKGIDDITTYTKKAERAAADSIRAELAKSSPELARLNEAFTFWQNVQDVALSTAQRQIGQEGPGYFARGAGALFGGWEGQKQGGWEGALIGSFLGEKGVAYLKSPAWKTVSAVYKNRLAEALARSDKAAVALIIGKLTGGVRNLAQTPPGTTAP